MDKVNVNFAHLQHIQKKKTRPEHVQYARSLDISVLSFLKPHFYCLFIDEAKLHKKV